MPISEAELIEIEGRAEALLAMPADAVAVVGEALTDFEDYRVVRGCVYRRAFRIAMRKAEVRRLDAEAQALVGDIARLVAEVRGARLAGRGPAPLGGGVMAEIGSVMTAETAVYSERLGREVEVLLRADGSGEVMAAEEGYFELGDARADECEGAFVAVACFDSIADLRRLLEEK